MSLLILILFLLLAVIVIYIYGTGPTLPPESDSVIDSVLTSELPEIVVGQTGFAISNGLKIWYESITPASAPKGTVLMVMANAGNALDWPPKFVQAFVDAGYQVIRYDNRGTGMSDWVINWERKNPYSLADMANDAVAVLDTLHVPNAHVVGLSMGGMIAQEIAINHPDRVRSLTLMMTSGYIGDPTLPNLSSSYFFTYLAKGLPLLKYRLAGGEKNLIEERIAKTMSVVGDEALDIKEIAEVTLYDLRKRRGTNVKAIFQHQTAVAISGSRYEKLSSLTMPTLVIHGTADQFIPVKHGKKLVDVIPSAKGVWLDAVGHVFPPPDMDVWMPQIIQHLDNS